MFRKSVLPPIGVAIDLYMRKSAAEFPREGIRFVQRNMRSPKYMSSDICCLQLLVIDQVQCADTRLGKTHRNVRPERTASEYDNRRFLQHGLRRVEASSMYPVMIDANNRVSSEVVAFGESIKPHLHGHIRSAAKATKRIFRVCVF